MSTSIVLSVVSDDHPGIVESLSELLAAQGGNWTESSMLSLAGKFAGILLANVPEKNASAFIEGLKALENKGIQNFVSVTQYQSHRIDPRCVVNMRRVYGFIAMR